MGFVHIQVSIKPGFHKANYDHDNDRFQAKIKRLMSRMTAQLHNRFVFCVVVVEFAVNGNQALICKENCSLKSVNGNGYKSNFEYLWYYFVSDMSNWENNAHINQLMLFQHYNKVE